MLKLCGIPEYGKSRRMKEGTWQMRQIKIHEQEVYKNLGDLYGLFFEDINHAADGGLYAELVQNRSFEYCEIDRADYHALTAWEKSGEITWAVCDSNPLNEENTHYLHVEAQAGAFVKNLGYNSGIYVEAGKKYDFSVYAKIVSMKKDASDGVDECCCGEMDKAAHMTIKVAIEDDAGKVCAEDTLLLENTQWQQYGLTLEATDTTWNGRLVITFMDGGSCELDMVSLFPQDTFKGRKNGLRRDIAEALQEMHPKFMRFPGGCLVHDGSLNDHDRNSMYRWKRTLGKVEERPSWRNNWGYNQTLGLGYYEYFCFCEDIGAKPLPVLPGGFNPHKGEGVPLEELDAWVQDALDLIAFANDPADTKWGAVRAQMGHEVPFGLEYIGIGNEEIGEGFFERYPYFHQAIKAKYPEIKIINTAGPFAVGEGYEDGWASARKYGSDLVDEHYYSSPEWFLANMHHYEDFDANGPKIFLGEYASWGNTYYNALVEAAYMTHLERSKAVALACYAPMLCNADYVNWQPDMLWFDNHRIMKTPNYYVQKLFMCHQGTDAVRFEKNHFEDAIPLVDEANITGDIAIAGNDVEGRIWDVRLTEYTDGLTNGVTDSTDKVQILPDFMVKEDNALNVLTRVDSSHYKITFRFKRNKGRKGLKIFFGRKDDKNTVQWEFGGWDNWDCNLTTIYNGRGSIISHRIFHVEDKEYFLELEVKGRHITTTVNGENYNDVTDYLPELEDLYVTASVDAECGKTYLKVVNLTGEAKETEVVLAGEGKCENDENGDSLNVNDGTDNSLNAKSVCKSKKMANITMLKGNALTDVNSLEQPDVIMPKTEQLAVEDNRLVYTFAPHSVTVITFA